mgnify:CR=1 FL=1
MTNEQILEELKKLKANATIHASVPTTEEQTNVNNEVESLDETIADYNEQIAALEAKIADPNNYQYNYDNEERNFTIELLQESFENQLEVMDREDAEYKSLQDIATSIFTDYNLEIQSLNLEIEAIERRFRKNDVAVKKNIGIRLTDQELTNLQADLESKKDRLAVCEEMKTKYVEDLRNYGELITANNHKREIVIGKQNSLNRIIENKKNNPKTIDNFKLQSDKDELARLKAGVAALKSRKDYITYNPSEEIDKLIAMVSAGKGIETNPVEDTVAKEEKKNDEVSKAETLINAYNQEFEPEENKDQDLGVIAPIVGNNEELEKEEKDKDATIIPTPVPVSTPEMEDISSHSDDSKEEPEEEKSEEDKIEDAYVVPNELDEEREAEIEDAKEELKKKKKDNFFKKHWKKFVAVGLGVVVIAALAKGCHKTTDLNKTKDNSSKNDSYSQTDDGIIDNNQNDIDNKYEFENPTIKPSPGNTTVTPSTPSTPTVNPDTKTPDTPSTPDSKPSTPDTPSTPDKPDVPDTPVTPEEPTVEKEKVELEAGEKLASLDDILKGNTGKENVISHGDEVGKKIDGAELKDYTEDGKAQIDLDKKDDTSKDTSTVQDPDEWKKALEDFMGGEITFDNNQWLDEMTNGKTR